MSSDNNDNASACDGYDDEESDVDKCQSNQHCWDFGSVTSSGFLNFMRTLLYNVLLLLVDHSPLGITVVQHCSIWLRVGTVQYKSVGTIHCITVQF